jgi:hypothetical protein
MTRTASATLVTFGLALAAVGSIGCVPVDVMMRSPVTANAVDQNQIVKEHRFAENSRALPVGALADSASLTRVTEQDICFDVTMHELDPIDMQTVRAKLSVQGQVPREQAQLWPEQPVSRQYSGMVPERVQTGYETYCASYAYNGVCIAWATRPIYGIVMRPGQVNVYETRARMCFPNGGFVSAYTENLVLELTVPRPAQNFNTTYTGWGWAWGAGDKRTRFAWGFTGFQKKK